MTNSSVVISYHQARIKMTGRSHQHILQAKEIETTNFKSKTVSIYSENQNKSLSALKALDNFNCKKLVEGRKFQVESSQKLKPKASNEFKQARLWTRNVNLGMTLSLD